MQTYLCEGRLLIESDVEVRHDLEEGAASQVNRILALCQQKKNRRHLREVFVEFLQRVLPCLAE